MHLGCKRVFAIWYELRAGDDLPVSAVELARCTGLSKTTVLRYLRAMESQGDVRRIGRGRWVLWEPITEAKR